MFGFPLNTDNIITLQQAKNNLTQGVNFNQQGDFDSAINCLKLAYSFFSKNVKYYHNEYAQAAYFLGCCYKEKGEHEFAKSYLKKAYNIYEQQVKQTPSISLFYLLFNATIDRVQCYLSMEKNDQALTILEAIKNNFLINKQYSNYYQDENVKNCITNLFLLLGECAPSPKEALSYFLDEKERGLSAIDETLIQIKMGMIHIELNDFEQALSILKNIHIKKISQLNSTFQADYFYHLARCWAQFGQFNYVQNYLLKAYHLYDETTPMRASAKKAASFGLALLYYKSGDRGKGDEYLVPLSTDYSFLSDLSTANQFILDWCEVMHFPSEFNFQTNPNLQMLNNLLMSIENSLDKKEQKKPRYLQI